MAEQKSQHWVPKFYLRNFSSDTEQKQLNLFQVEQGRFIPNINLGHQCADDYFYGKDLLVEKTFGPLESAWAQVFRELHDKGVITPETREHLIAFAGLQYGRTKGAVDEINEMSDKMKTLVLDPYLVASGKLTPEEAAATKIRFENPAGISLRIVASSLPLLSDLDIKLIRPHAGGSFVTSDTPVVLFNQAFHGRGLGGTAGLALKGLQIFFPIGPTLAVMLFDREYYRVGSPKTKVVTLMVPDDTEQLNALQLVNCLNNLYCKETNRDTELKQLKQRYVGLRNPENSEATVEKVKVAGDPNPKELIWGRKLDLRLSPRCSFCTILNKHRGETHKLDQIEVRNLGLLEELQRREGVR